MRVFMNSYLPLCVSPLIVLLLSVVSHSVFANERLTKTIADIEQQFSHTLSIERKALNAREQSFLKQTQKQAKQLSDIKSTLKKLQTQRSRLDARYAKNEKQLTDLSTQLAGKQGELGEFYGLVRQSLEQAKPKLTSGLLSVANYDVRADFFERVETQGLPRLQDLEALWLMLLQDIRDQGQIANITAPVRDTQGNITAQPVLTFGPFMAWQEASLLQASNDFFKPYERTFLPSDVLQSKRAYLQAQPGTWQAVVLDPAQGASLQALAQQPTVLARIAQGGVVAYIILALGALGVGIFAYRGWQLAWVGKHMAATAQRVQTQSDTDKTFDLSKAQDPLAKVLKAGQYAACQNAANEQDAELIENALDEVIVTQSAKLEKGLSLLKVMAAMAPLLGLLGTVMGMINTFHAITLYGNSDPKLMAAGISQALVTTMLGLIVAAPLLLAHTLMASRSRRLVQILEAQSAGFLALALSQVDSNSQNMKAIDKDKPDEKIKPNAKNHKAA